MEKIENEVLNHSDIHIVEVGKHTIILVGTAHISKESANLVRSVIETEKPDVVCVELDPQRYQSLVDQKKWESLDLKTVIRKKQLTTLLINLLLASYQKKLGQQLGVQPGVELLEAVRAAEENNIPIALCDRDIRITLRRAWSSMGLMDKLKLLTAGFASLFEREEISEEKLAEIRQKDVLNEMIAELGEAMPTLKRVLIDERDTYLAQKISEAKGEKIVAVVGAGHVQGMIKALQNHKPVNLSEIEQIPPVSPVWKALGWGIPAVIIGSLLYIGWTKGAAAASDNAIYWFLANGIPSAIGGAIAFAHPITIITAFLAAPFTSLTPVIGAGYVCAFVQAYLAPPVVKEIQSVSEDINTLSKWWKNRLLRIFLVFILTSLGSAIGTYVGAYEIIGNLF
jgi:pheromone shutdown-related protein TraB